MPRHLGNKTERQKGILAIILLVVCYGILPLIPRYLSTSFDLFQQVYLRLGLGCLLTFLLFRGQINLPKITQLPPKEIAFIALRAFIYYFFGVILFNQALLLTKISNVTFIAAVPMTAILGFTILGEKFSLQKVMLVLFSFLGVISISVQDFSNFFNFGIGELVAILSTVFISLGFVSRKWQTENINDKETAFLMLFFATIFVFFGSLLKGEGLPLHNWHLGVVLAIALGGLLNAGVSFLMNYGFARLDAVLASNLIALDPVVAALFAYLVFREVPLPKELFGGGVILFSAILMDRVEAKESTR